MEKSLEPKLVLFSKKMDAWLLGGASILFFVIFWIFFRKDTDTGHAAEVTYLLSFIINFPHFMMSYFLFYGHFSEMKQMPYRRIFAGLAAPLILLSIMFYSFYKSSSDPMVLSIHAMYFLVGWHYVKQIFGICMFNFKYETYYISRFFRISILFSLYTLWIFNWMNWNRSGAEYDFYGIAYKSLKFTGVEILYWISTALLIISLLAVLFYVFKKFIASNQWPPVGASVAYISIFLWYLPVLYHPIYFLFIPMFHSLQYLVFALAIKRNDIMYKKNALDDDKFRALLVASMAVYIFLAVILGGATFEWFPKLIDSNASYEKDILGYAFFAAAFSLFINIHHYFIDSVLWKKKNTFLQRLS